MKQNMENSNCSRLYLLSREWVYNLEEALLICNLYHDWCRVLKWAAVVNTNHSLDFADQCVLRKRIDYKANFGLASEYTGISCALWEVVTWFVGYLDTKFATYELYQLIDDFAKTVF